MSKHLYTAINILLLAIIIFLLGKQNSNDTQTPTSREKLAEDPHYSISPENFESKDEFIKLQARKTELEYQNALLKLRVEMLEIQFKTNIQPDNNQAANVRPNHSVYDQFKLELDKLKAENKAIKKQLNGNADFKISNPVKSFKINPNQKRKQSSELSQKEQLKIDNRASSHFAIIENQVKKCLRDQRYGNAFFHIGNFPTSLLGTPGGKELIKLKQSVHNAIKIDYEDQEKIALKYAAKGEFTMAISHLSALKAHFSEDPMVTKRLNKKVYDLETKYRNILDKPFVKKKVKKAPDISKSKKYELFIEQLGSTEYIEVKAARTAIQNVGDEAIGALILGTGNKNNEIKRNCIILLGQLKVRNNKKAVNAIVSSLRDRNADVVHSALKTIGKVKIYTAMEEIIALVNKSTFNNNVAKEAIKSFESLVDFNIPGSKFATADSMNNIQNDMKTYWKKHKEKFTSE